LFVTRQGLSYKLSANHLADYTEEEMRMLRGKIHDPELKYNGGLPFSYTPQQLGKRSVQNFNIKQDLSS
jgi:hypothetical protein